MRACLVHSIFHLLLILLFLSKFIWTYLLVLSDTSDTSAVNFLVGCCDCSMNCVVSSLFIFQIESMLLINFSRRDVFERLGLKFVREHQC